MKLILAIMMLSTSMGSFAQQSKKKPQHSWEVFMKMPEAKAEAKKYEGHCGDTANQAVMNACFSGEADSTEEQLNKTYRATLAKLAASQKNELRIVQRSWLKYRDLQCKAAGAIYDGGSLQPTIVASCISGLNLARIKELQDTYLDI